MPPLNGIVNKWTIRPWIGFSAFKTQLIFNGYNCRAAMSEKRGMKLPLRQFLQLSSLCVRFISAYNKPFSSLWQSYIKARVSDPKCQHFWDISKSVTNIIGKKTQKPLESGSSGALLRPRVWLPEVATVKGKTLLKEATLRGLLHVCAFLQWGRKAKKLLDTFLAIVQQPVKGKPWQRNWQRTAGKSEIDNMVIFFQQKVTPQTFPAHKTEGR